MSQTMVDRFDAAELAKNFLLSQNSEKEFVGELLEIEETDEHLNSYYFASLHPGYIDWKWLVVVAKIDESSEATICDSVLVPSDNALLAPEWIAYEDRLLPGDLKPGDIIPTRADDERLTTSQLPEDEELDLFEIFELGAGKARVLSITGRDLASKRWYESDHGPKSPYALSASKPCGGCGFYIPLSGPLKKTFGVCANLLAPDDGRVVSVDHGCGAHSEILVR
jgi:Protein of unknown function (DUF3027)